MTTIYHFNENHNGEHLSEEHYLKHNKKSRQYLLDKKNEIDATSKWDIAKKYANEFEFVFSFNYDCIANKVPISRSYFKLIEIIMDNALFEDFREPIHCACLCEGPGGFIQAIHDCCRKYHLEILSPITCITLLSDNRKIPKWKLSEIPKHVYDICYGQDGTGNIYKMKNMDFFINACSEKKIFVTADGGFDFSNDFNSQEEHFILLLLCEIYIGINVQALNGHFVIKCFDIFHENTIHIIAFLRSFYKDISIQKPKTSRPANSEKYIICTYFKPLTQESQVNIDKLRQKILKHEYNLSDLVDNKMYLSTLYNVQEFNKVFVSNQIFYINKTIEYSKKMVFDDKQKHIEKCKQWCKHYDIPIKPIYF